MRRCCNIAGAIKWGAGFVAPAGRSATSRRPACAPPSDCEPCRSVGSAMAAATCASASGGWCHPDSCGPAAPRNPKARLARRRLRKFSSTLIMLAHKCRGIDERPGVIPVDYDLPARGRGRGTARAPIRSSVRARHPAPAAPHNAQRWSGRAVLAWIAISGSPESDSTKRRHRHGSMRASTTSCVRTPEASDDLVKSRSPLRLTVPDLPPVLMRCIGQRKGSISTSVTSCSTSKYRRGRAVFQRSWLP